MSQRIRQPPMTLSPHVSDFAGALGDPELELAAAIIASSAGDGYLDCLAPIVDTLVEQATGVERAGTALALHYYDLSRCGVAPYRDNHLRTIRETSGISKHALALRCQAAPTTIRNIEEDDVYPNARLRQRIAAALGVTEAEIWPPLT